MSDAVTLPAAYTSDTPIFSALAASHRLFSASVTAPDAARRAPSHRDPAWLSRSCLVPHSPMGGRHRRASTLVERAHRTGRHHLVTAGHS